MRIRICLLTLEPIMPDLSKYIHAVCSMRPRSITSQLGLARAQAQGQGAWQPCCWSSTSSVGKRSYDIEPSILCDKRHSRDTNKTLPLCRASLFRLHFTLFLRRPPQIPPYQLVQPPLKNISNIPWPSHLKSKKAAHRAQFKEDGQHLPFSGGAWEVVHASQYSCVAANRGLPLLQGPRTSSFLGGRRSRNSWGGWSVGKDF